MSNFMMNLVSWILLLLVILTLYLIDKVNQLARLQEQTESDQEKSVADLQLEARLGISCLPAWKAKPSGMP